MALKPADKKIIDAFTDGNPDIPEGAKSDYYARGGTLYGPMGSKLARLKHNWVVWIGTGGTQYQDDTYRYLKRSVPPNKFKESETTPNGKSEFGFVHDAKTHDFLRPASRADMLQSLKTPSGEYSEGGRRVYVRNGAPPPPPRRGVPSSRSARPPTPPSQRPRHKFAYMDIIHEAEREKYPFDYAVRNGAVDPQALEALKEVVVGLPVGHASGYISTLGGASRASLLFTISLDPRQDWNHGILENSRYAKFHLSFEKDKWVLEQLTRNKVEKIRKYSTPDFKKMVQKLQDLPAALKGATLRKNSGSNDWANEIILRGIILGFWLQGWADAMQEAGNDIPSKIDEHNTPEPPEELNEFAMKFALDFSAVNGNKPLFAMARLHEDELEEFGYAVAMEAVGHGSDGWLDDHDRGHLKIPAVEVHFELEDQDDEESAVLTWAESSKRLAV